MKQLPDNFDWEAVADYRAAARRVRDHVESAKLTRRLGVEIKTLLNRNGWIVGSHVWMPALGLWPDMGADVDLVFTSQVMLDAASRALMATGLYDRGKNGWGNDSFSERSSGQKAADVWLLPDGQSIAEHVIGFGQRHERVAFAVGVPVDVALTRFTHVHYGQSGGAKNLFADVKITQHVPPAYRGRP